MKTCANVSAVMKDGSIKNLGSYNTRSSGDMASGLSVAIPGLKGSSGNTNGSVSGMGTTGTSAGGRKDQAAETREKGAARSPSSSDASISNGEKEFSDRDMGNYSLDEGWIVAENDVERQRFKDENRALIFEAMKDVGKYYPGLKKYLKLSNDFGEGSEWVSTAKGIRVPLAIWNGNASYGDASGKSMITGYVAHEALHGWVRAHDPHYDWNEFITDVLVPDGNTYKGRPHFWIDNKGSEIGMWIASPIRGVRPQWADRKPSVTMQGYWKCLDTGECK